MKTKIPYLLILACAICFSFAADNKPVWEGHWTETWGVNQVTDIDYHDKYTISKDDVTGNMHIWSTDKENYKFCDVSVNGNELDLKLINMTGWDTMPYHLIMEPGSKLMKGIAYSIYGEKTNIEWARDEK